MSRGDSGTHHYSQPIEGGEGQPVVSVAPILGQLLAQALALKKVIFWFQYFRYHEDNMMII